MAKKRIITALVVLFLVFAAAFCIYNINSQTKAKEIEVSKAGEIVNSYLDAAANSKPLKYIAEKNSIIVNSVSYGDQKDVILDCTIKTIDAHGIIKPHYEEFLGADVKKKNGTMFKSALDFKLEFEDGMVELLKKADKKTNKATIVLYDVGDSFKVYADDKTLNAVFGGIADIKKEIYSFSEITLKDGSVKKLESTNINKGFVQCFEPKTENVKPETANGIVKFWNKLKRDFEINFFLILKL